MSTRFSGTAGTEPRVVGVVSSLADLHRALRLRRAPHLFELRLDALSSCLGDVQRMLGKLRAPLIITARHPAEGGTNRLSAQRRAAVLLRFLPNADYVDIELRSVAQMQAVLHNARHSNVQLILSVHDLRRTPAVARMQQLARCAEEHGADIFKLATRTDTAAQLARLIQFVDGWRSPLAISVMGIGKLGRASRAAFLRRGSALNYAHLSSATVDGQFSLDELRRECAAIRPPQSAP